MKQSHQEKQRVATKIGFTMKQRFQIRQIIKSYNLTHITPSQLAQIGERLYASRLIDHVDLMTLIKPQFSANVSEAAEQAGVSLEVPPACMNAIAYFATLWKRKKMDPTVTETALLYAERDFRLISELQVIVHGEKGLHLDPPKEKKSLLQTMV